MAKDDSMNKDFTDEVIKEFIDLREGIDEIFKTNSRDEMDRLTIELLKVIELKKLNTRLENK